MNFKNISFLFFYLLIISSCGVKKAPMRPADKVIPSYVEEFEQKNQTPQTPQAPLVK